MAMTDDRANPRADVLAKLTPRQWRFVHEYVYGRHAGEGAACYAIAYDRPRDRTAHANASRALSKPKVAQAVEALRDEMRRSQRLTPEGHLSTLADLRDAAKAQRRLSAAIRAEELRGRAMGFYAAPAGPDAEPTPDAEALAEQLQALLRDHPDLWAMIAPPTPAE